MRRLVLGVAAGLALLGGPAAAQNFPSKPVTVIIGLPTGGNVNAVMAIYGDALTRSMGHRVILDNKPGGGGITGAIALTQAAPDGHTIMVALGGLHTIAPAMQQLPFHPLDDFEPVSLLYSLPNYLAVPGNSPVNSVKELMDYAKTKPQGLNFGSQSVGSPGHIMGEMFKDKVGAPMTHVAYRGGGPMNIDLIAGRIDFGFPTAAIAIGPAKEKQMKLLAIVGKRFAGTPDVPSFDEVGIGDIGIDSLFGIYAPKGTPKAIIQRLNDELVKASRDPELVRRMNELALVIRATPPEELTRAFKADLDRLGAIVRAKGIKAE